VKRKIKTVDCVKIKDRIQRELMQEYEMRKSEFPSYVDFINAVTDADPRVQSFRRKVAEAQASSKA
jgi:hypothetical protein